MGQVSVIHGLRQAMTAVKSIDVNRHVKERFNDFRGPLKSEQPVAARDPEFDDRDTRVS